MKAVQVLDWASGPKLIATDSPEKPSSSTTQIRVIAAGLHQLVRTMAAGKHYSTKALPHTPGTDGVGIDLATNKLVYFFLMGIPGRNSGSFVEIINVPTANVVELPDGVDPIQVAALVNPVMSSWMALRERVGVLNEGWTCLVLGATSASGTLAIKIARALGATKIYGAARSQAKLDLLDLDEKIVLQEPPSATDFSVASTASVALDYLYGSYAQAFFESLAAQKYTGSSSPLTYVSIGSLSGGVASIPSSLLRSRDITIRGAGFGAWDIKKLGEQIPGMIGFLKGYKMESVKAVSAEDVETAWNQPAKDGARLVFVFDKHYLGV